MQEIDDRVPSAVRYPIEEVANRFGVPHFDMGNVAYLTSTAAYMLALALMEHQDGNTIDAIHSAGIEMQIGTEYTMQRPCVEYYIGWARGMGIEWKPAPGTSLLRAPVYAVDHDMPFKDNTVVPLGPSLQPINPTDSRDPMELSAS